MLISEVICNNQQPQCKKPRLPATPIPSPVKREVVRQNLTKQFARAANAPTISKDDIRVAADRFVTNQKRVNLEYEKQQRLATLRHKSRSRSS